MSFSSSLARIDAVSPPDFSSVTISVLRLDLIHPVVSGNKCFKLKGYVADAKAKGKTTLLTFGGAYSNHILATAAAAQMSGLKSVGVIRGGEPAALSPTLVQAKQYGMQLHFVSRETYRQKMVPQEADQNNEAAKIYTVPEGGYGPLGMEGAMDILLQNDALSYTHIFAAVGTGTTLAGLIAAAAPHQKIIGIPVLKNAFSLQSEIERLLPPERKKGFELKDDYHFGGYAKYSSELIAFMNGFYKQTAIPTDFVYTGKAFFAAIDLIQQNHFPSDSRLLLIHTGGLQGNRSLKKGTLIYE